MNFGVNVQRGEQRINGLVEAWSIKALFNRLCGQNAPVHGYGYLFYGSATSVRIRLLFVHRLGHKDPRIVFVKFNSSGELSAIIGINCS